MFCVSKTRGVSSPFICYRLGKISKYIFTTGYANVTAYKKRACSPPIMANRGERFDSSFLKKEEGWSKYFTANNAWHHPAVDIHGYLSRHSFSDGGCRNKTGMDIPLRGSVFATLRRDRADGGTPSSFSKPFNYIALFPIWGDICILCFFSGDLLRPPHPRSRVRPGAIWRHSRDVSDWVVSGIICGEVFALSFLFFEEWWSKSFTAISHNWGIAVHCYRNSLYPKPLNFLFSKNNFIIYPQWEQSV